MRQTNVNVGLNGRKVATASREYGERARVHSADGAESVSVHGDVHVDYVAVLQWPITIALQEAKERE